MSEMEAQTDARMDDFEPISYRDDMQSHHDQPTSNRQSQQLQQYDETNAPFKEIDQQTVLKASIKHESQAINDGD